MLPVKSLSEGPPLVQLNMDHFRIEQLISVDEDEDVPANYPTADEGMDHEWQVVCMSTSYALTMH